jgi:CubicO group peptidase (beta-lactamase class C family)
MLCLVLTAVFGAAPLAAQPVPVAASPESVGLSSPRLAHLGAVMREYAESGKVAGLVTLVLRHGKVAQFESYGQQDLEQHLPMQKDTVFRIASQSKAVTSVAILMLMEDGKLLLGDPVSRFIPAFRRRARSRSATCSRTPRGSRTAAAPPPRSGRRPASTRSTSRTRTNRSDP